MNLSRNPTDYEYDCESHAGNKKRERNISLDAMDHAIENGDAKESRKGRINFEAKWSGETITVVVDPKNDYIVTTFYGTGTTGKALEEAQERKSERKSPYAGAWR